MSLVPSNTPRRARWALCLAAAALIVTSCGSDEPAKSVPSTLATTTASTSATTTVAERAEPATSVARQAVETTTAQTPPPSTEPPSESCRRLTDFDSGDGWAIVNDGVMGGRSVGAVEFADSTMRFTGGVVTAGGGFTSVRLQLSGDELADSDYLALRVRTDARTYGLTLEDLAQTGRRAVSHGADLTIDGPMDADSWQTTELSYDDLSASVFGQPIDAPPFEPNQATEIGIIIGDGIDGPFALDVDWIDACRSL